MDNIFVFIFISLINSFAFMSAMTNLLFVQPSIVNRVFVYIYISLCQIFFGQFLGQNIIYFTIGGALLIVAVSSKKYLSNIIFSLLGYLIAVVINYVIVALFTAMGTTVAMIYSDNQFLILFVILYCILTFILTYFLGRYLRNYFIKDILYLPKQIKVFCTLEVIFCTLIFAYNIIEAEKKGYSSISVYYNTILFGSFLTVTFVIFMICLRIMLREVENENKSLRNYAMKLEDLYQYMNNYRMNYSNVFSEIQSYINNDSDDSFQMFYETKLLPFSQGLENDKNIVKLERIKLLEIKGILYSKLILALNLKLNIIFEINDDIDNIYMDMLDLSIVIDEFMKNAIEAAIETLEKEILVVLNKNNEYVSLIISNSSLDTNINLDIIYDEGETSKREHLGNGLFIARQHLNKYSNIIHTTTFNNRKFTQKLEI